MWSALSGTLNALPKVSDRVELPPVFLVLYTLCSVKVFIFGDPMDVYLSGFLHSPNNKQNMNIYEHSRRQTRRSSVSGMTTLVVL